MLRLLGALLTFFSCTAVGVYLQRRLVRRVQILDDLCCAFAMLRTEIEFLQTPLFQATEKIAAATKSVFFIKLCPLLQKGKSPPDAVRMTLAEMENVLTAADAAPLVQVSLQLGVSDVHTQVQHIDAALAQLRMQHKQAQTQMHTNGRLYLAFGMLGGVLLVLLLL